MLIIEGLLAAVVVGRAGGTPIFLLLMFLSFSPGLEFSQACLLELCGIRKQAVEKRPPPCHLTGGCHCGLGDQGSLWMPGTGNSPLLGQQACWPRSELKPCLGIVLSKGSHIDSAHLSWVKSVGSGVHSLLQRLPAVVPGASSWTSLCLSIFAHRMGCSQYFLCRLT